MKFTNSAIQKVILSLSLFLFSVTTALALTDVAALDIDGFRLGMPMDEALKLAPGMVITEVKPDGDLVIGYKGTVGGLTILFASHQLGKVIINVERKRIYNSKPDSYPIFARLEKKYGPPDFTGRRMFRVNSCWGKCFGFNKRLEFILKIAGIGSQPYPMTLTLSDPALAKENRDIYKKIKAEEKAQH